MRELHKWKDRVDVSLDNRQLFFLFFGLSVVGCFVFALGVMVGKRLEWSVGVEQGHAASDSLALLSGAESELDEFSFEEALKTPATDGKPDTRDPELVEAEAKARAEEEASAKASREVKPAAPSPEAEAKTAAPSVVKPAVAAAPVPTVMASVDDGTGAAAEVAGPRNFTLQMKAFARAEEAETFAAGLRKNGHEVRVEGHEIRGRTWHRVRLGHFRSWDQALAAKAEFERGAKVIAYVVRE